MYFDRHNCRHNYNRHFRFLDSSRTQIWLNSNPDWYSGTGNGGTQTIIVYGRVFGNQTPLAGTYTDTVVATITW
ncbi:MAG: spore coat protein U domain-containing protein [Nitrospirae bacterium]|nr:spore coat protein U domain-containing protein [Nitrospirota bacterium]